MGLSITPEALDVLRRSLRLGGLDEDAGGIRLRAARALGGGVDVQVELADSPAEEEIVLEEEGVRLFVDPRIFEVFPDAVVSAEPQHDVVVVRPAQP
jgi:Fe-S cluster assembly iron-binding protein IscA